MNLKTPASRFSVDGKHFENGVFRNNDINVSIFFLLTSFPHTQIQNDRWLLRRKRSFQIFPSVDGAYVDNSSFFQRCPFCKSISNLAFIKYSKF